MKRNFLIFAFLLFISDMFAQTFSLKGSVISEETGEKLAFASVVLYENDSIYKSGTTTNTDGEFIIANLQKNTYRIKISFVGYEIFEIVKDIFSDTDLGKIKLKTESVILEDAVVTMTRPVIEQKIDKTVVNVSNSVAAEGNSAFDMLRNSPGVTIDSEGNVQLNGKAVSVWIDGRPSYLSGKDLEAYLNAIEATSLDKIELISNPSAKYDAEGGGGIIDLKIKKNRLSGFNGSIRAGHDGKIFNKKYYHYTNASVNLNYRSKISNTFFSYSPNFGSDFTEFKSDFYDIAQKNWKQISNALSQSNSSRHSLRLGTDFFINKRNTIGFIVNSFLGNNQSNQKPNSTYNQTFVNDTLQETSNTLINSIINTNNVSANLNYTSVFDEEKNSELTVNLDYLYWSSKDSSYNDNRYFKGDGVSASRQPLTFLQDMQQDINVYSIKADFQHTFIKKLLFESGLKVSVSQTKNTFLRENFEANVWLKDINRSSDFCYTEQIYALYASLGAQFNTKWSLKGGLRGEYTYNIGDWITQSRKTYRNYFDIFPTIFASYQHSEKYNFALSYTMRIGRPSYWQLKPFRSYIDENTVVEGNPELLPQRTHHVAFKTSLISYFNINLNYHHTTNLPSQILTFDGKEKVYKWENWGKQNALYLGLACSEYPLVKNRLTMSLYADLGYVDERNKKKDFRNQSFFSSFYGNLTLILPKDWKIEAYGWGNTGGSTGYFKYTSQGMLSFAVRKSFLEQKLQLNLKFENILNTNNSDLNYQQGNIKYNIRQIYSAPSFGLSISYNFGKVTHTKYRKVGEVEESSRLGSGK